jgi:hypothetical protein
MAAKGYYAAHGRFIIMSDAEDSYEFLLLPRFDEKLCHGFDLVRRCRLPSQGYGAARRDAMLAPLA